MADQHVRNSTGDSQVRAAASSYDATDGTARRASSERPVGALSAARDALARSSGDPRFVRFMKAVQALRLDYDAPNLSAQRIADLREAARDIFMMDDGVPRRIRPAGTDTNDAEAARQERAEAAERREKLREAEMREAKAKSDARAAERAEARLPAEPGARQAAAAPVLPEVRVPERPEARVARPAGAPEARVPDQPEQRVSSTGPDRSGEPASTEIRQPETAGTGTTD